MNVKSIFIQKREEKIKMNKKNINNRLICKFGIILVLSIMFLMGSSHNASAATRKCYTILDKDTIVYSNTQLTKKYGKIYGSDEIIVIEVHDSYSKVQYKISGSGGKTKTGYISTSAILTATGGTTISSRAKIITYKRPGGQEYGYVSQNDPVLVLGVYGSYTQVKYPVLSGYKYAFIITSDADKYLKTSNNSVNNSIKVPNGIYKLVSALNNSFVLDIENGSKLSESNLQLYLDNGTPAQQYSITMQEDGYYSISNVNSGLMIDCYGGHKTNGTNIWQYDNNNSDAQHWKLIDAGDGYYYLQCKCNGLVADVTRGDVYNGNNIQMYEINYTLSQKFKLIPVTANSVELSTIQSNIYNLAINSIGNKGTIYQKWAGLSTSDPYCAAYATYICNQAMIQAGYTKSQATGIVPKHVSTSKMADWYNQRGRYHSYASWYNSNRGVGVYKNTTISSYNPQVGDLVVIDNNGKISSGPEHTGIVIAVENNSITLAEGNTGAGTNATRRVKKYTYYKGDTYWYRSDYKKSVIVGFCTPKY